MSEVFEEQKKDASKLNTILLYVTLAVLAFIARVSWTNAIQLAGVVPRAEMETKISEVKAGMLVTEKEIAAINLELVRLQAALATREIIQKPR